MKHYRFDPLARGRTGSWQSYDPFATNPVRRSALAVAVSGAILFVPGILFGYEAASLVILSCGWLAAAVLAFSVPVLILSSIEEGWRQVARRLQPTIYELELSPRVYSLLRRHGFESISRIDRTPDSVLLMLSNFDARALAEVRRAISLWKYRRWQDAGFPVNGYD